MSVAKHQLAGLSREEKLELLAKLAARKARATEEPKRYPLSFAQERNWFLSRLDPESPAHSIFRCWRLRGVLDLDRLEAAMRDVVCRHGSLRTTFAEEDGGSVQVVAPSSSAQAFVLDRRDLTDALRSLGDDARDARLGELAAEESRRPFDLESQHLVRVAVLRLDDDDHALFLTLHHIIADGWSMGLLFRELRELYAARTEGRRPTLPDLSIQVGDFAVWQRQKLDLDAQLEVWRDALDGAPTVLDVPTDRPRPAVASLRGDFVDFALDLELSDRIRRFAGDHGATLFMVLLAAFQALLHRLTDQRDLLVGSPIANRHRNEIEGLIGSFANTIVLRSRLGAEWPSFAELLEHTRRQALAAYDHQDLPFERLVEALQPERDLSRNPLFQVMFSILDQDGGGRIRLPGVEVSKVEVDRGLSKVDLTLEMITAADGEPMSGYVEYATDLFDRATIERFIRRFTAWLDAAIADPSRSIGTLPILIDDERQRLDAINDTARPDVDLDTPVHGLVERVGETCPDAVAVVACEALSVADDSVRHTGSLTYRELLDRSARLARHLVEVRGVRRGDRVAVCLEHSVEATVAFLAVLRAGAAYVPMDPAYPTERVRVTVEDSGARWLLAGSILDDRDLGGHLPDGVDIVVLDRDFDALTAASEDDDATPPAVEVSPDDVAYIIYTSGSTGRPKGVVVHHRAAANLAQAMVERFELTPEDRCLQFASLAFDVSFEEVFSTWLAGATVVMRPDHQSLALADFFRLLDRERVSVVNLPVSYWHEWVAELKAGRLSLPATVRLVIAGGEGPLPERLDAWIATVGSSARMINAYGPTETTVDCIMWDAPEPSARPIRRVSIGRPIANARAWVVDHDLRPVPPGVPGELVIGGAGVAHGYLRRPVRTAETFLPDPFSSTPGGRLYRTGDRARVLADDTIECLGRVDFQVKIRGFRIETGEIEAALIDDPRVIEAAVMAKEVSPGDRRLVAWVTPVSPTASGLDEALRQALRDHLPGYMVPARIVVLPGGLPITSAGKVDRHALPDPDWAAGATSSKAPRTPIEAIVADVFRDVLDRDEVGVHDDFFCLGGHSLLAMRLLSRLRAVLELDLPLQAVFEAPTIAELARRIDDVRHETSGTAALPPIESIERAEGTRLPLSFAQQRMWFLAQLEPESPAYNMPNALRFEGPFDLDVLRSALGALHARHESLRTTFHADRGEPYARVASVDEARNDAPIDLPVEAADDLDAALISAKAESLRPFDLATGPMLRCRVVRIAEDDHLLVFTFHHIISDGWSTDLFIDQLLTLYGNPSEAIDDAALPPLAIHYADYAAWERSWLAGEVLERQLDYWREQLADAPTAIDLPTDRPRPAVARYRGGRAPIHLDAELVARLGSLAREHGVTAFMLYLATFATLLHRLCGQHDILIGTPVSGRRQTELESVIGFFANTLVMRFGFADAPHFATLLQRSREVVLGAHAHQDLPFERLVDEIRPERHLAHSPIFQTLFVLHQTTTWSHHRSDTAADSRSEGTPSARLVSVANQTSRFDLSLVLIERDEGFDGFLEFDADLFDASTAERFVGFYTRLLDGCSRQPERPVDRLPMIDAAERARLVQIPEPVAFPDADSTLPARFERCAAEHPDRVALRFEGASMTYAELARRSGRLARHLRSLGVREEVLVGVAMERSFELVVALLAIQRAGGAYVPIDPDYPAERIAFMIEDSGVAWVLTQAHLVERLPSLDGRTTRSLTVDTFDFGDPESAPADDAEAPPRRLDGDALAYMIYTSGSTGRPKGAANAHRGVLNRLSWTQAAYPMTPDDRVLQKTPYSFDVSVWEFFWPLMTGATLVVARPGGHQDPSYLVSTLATEQVTMLHFVPSMLQVFLDAKGLDALTSVRRVIASGEALPIDLVRRFDQRMPDGADLLNLYGPTEAAIDVTHSKTSPDDAKVVIGQPVANTSILVLDRHMEPAGVGIAGELYIGGVQLARGYHARPGLTAERFVPDPFADALVGGSGGGRLYRSGDLARVLPSGDVDYLGRLDHQVKVRGFRIELGEIEAAINDHPAMRESVVVAREQRLVGYVVRDEARQADDSRLDSAALIQSLQASLGERLPDYMVPQTFVVLDALPLSPNGKVDRRALPEPEIDRSTLATDFVAPRNDTEARIVEIWQHVLDLDQVGVLDRFFDLGGHSLLATQVMARLAETFDLELPLRTLFESPTVEGLANAVLAAEVAQADDALLEHLLSEL